MVGIVDILPPEEANLRTLAVVERLADCARAEWVGGTPVRALMSADLKKKEKKREKCVFVNNHISQHVEI